jgi:lysophospholipase L1-like esterase
MKPTRRDAIKSLLIVAPAAATLTAAEQSRPMQVFIAGDSTASEWGPEHYPELGWGMVLKCAFGDDVVVRNYAQSGRSSKSFIAEGFFAQIEREIRRGDTLLIQFGHNDQKIEDPSRYTNPEGDYRSWLMRYVDLARAKGAQPVLITPVARRRFANGVLIDTHAQYAEAVREVAAQSRTPVIDLTADSMRWISSLGDEASKRFYLEDNSHFTELGARKVADLVATRLVELNVPVSSRIKSARPGLTRDTPLGGPGCL